MRAVREREVEVARSSRSGAAPEAPGHRPCLAERAGAAVRGPDDVVRDPVQLEQLERLRVVAGGDLDVVAGLASSAQQRPEERHVRRVRDVDPDAHRADPSV